MQGMYSTRSPAVKRLMKEAQELREPTEQYHAQPLEDNLFEWHFTLRGPGETEFEEGIYHGRIILPPEYPMKPPSIIILTPNGRFEIFKKICLSISGHHPESWQPSWSIRTALLAIIGFMPTHGGGAIGSLDYPSDERKKLAKRSLEWKCPTCGNVNNILKPVTAASKETAREAKELASQINFQAEKQPGGETKDTSTKSSTSEATSDTSTVTASSPGASSPSATAPQQTQFPFPGGQNPFAAGQNPFPNFCFPPPFMAMPNAATSQQQSSNMPPRFPPPPPFIPAMFPPGFLQGMQPGGSATMPPWPGNPFMNANTKNVSQQNVNNQQQTSTSSAINATTSSTSEGPSQQNSSPSNQNQTSVESGNVSRSQNVENLPSGVQNNDSPQSRSQNDNISQSESDTRTVAPTSASESNLHQRLTNTDRRPATPGRVGQDAELPIRQQQQSYGRFSLVLMFLLGLAIFALLIRRFFLSRYWRF